MYSVESKVWMSFPVVYILTTLKRTSNGYVVGNANFPILLKILHDAAEPSL